MSGYEVPYNPELWDIDYTNEIRFPEVQFATNCYNYALNIHSQITEEYWKKYESTDITNSQKSYEYIVLQPGIFDGTQNNLTRNNIVDINLIIASVQEDSITAGFTFTPIGQYDVCPEGTYKVALVYGSGDYHWFRQNPDGTWSHKP